MSIYFLHSKRLGFRDWSEADMELALGLWGDVEVTRLIGGSFSAKQVNERLQKEIVSQQEHGFQYWPFFLLENDEHVGCCGLRMYKPEDQIYEIGFHLRKAHWGQGYALEAAQTVIDYAFNVREAQALFAGHNPANEASQGLLTRLGFQYMHDEYYAPTGLMHPSYVLTRPGE